MLTTSDIVFVFSGGQGNYDPFNSLGGNPSVIEVSEVSQGLFNSLSDEQLKSGITDYRCFYVFNQSDTDTLYDFSVYIQNTSIVSCYVGLNKKNDSQKITLSGSPTSGNLVLDYDGDQFTVEFSSNPQQLALNFQQQLVDIGLSGVVVTVEAKTGYYNINISFEGDSGFKYHPLISLVTNNLSPATSFFITKIQDGSPINMIVPNTQNVLETPENINFELVSPSNPISLATLKPNEGLPVWMKRVVEAGTNKNDSLSFEFKIKGRIIS
jgi:hypothetical protein